MLKERTKNFNYFGECFAKTRFLSFAHVLTLNKIKGLIKTKFALYKIKAMTKFSKYTIFQTIC